MQIFQTSYGGDTKLLKLVLTNSINPSELIFRVDQDNKTALHYTLNKDVAQLLVESVEPTKLKTLLWTVGGFWNKDTPLDSAVDEDRADVVEYLCSLTSANNELLKDGHYFPGYTTLQNAKSLSIMSTLVECIPVADLKHVLLKTEYFQTRWTVLHVVAMDRNNELVKYLCGLGIAELHTTQDIDGYIPLHYASTREAAQVMMKSLVEMNLEEYLYTVTRYKETPLHAMVRRDAELAAIEYYLDNLPCVDVVLSKKDSKGKTALHLVGAKEKISVLITAVENKDKYMMMADNDGKTALHYSITAEITAALITEAENKDKYISIADNEGKTALHYARTGEMTSLLIDAAKDVETYIFMTDNEGKTALHHAYDGDIAEVLISSAENSLDYIKIPDNEGQTALMCMALRGDPTTLQTILEYIEETHSEEDLQSLLLKTNNKRQNLFHLAAMSIEVYTITEILIDYIDVVKAEEILVPDIYNNTPLTYLTGRYDTHAFAEFIMRIPPWIRRENLMVKNQKGVTCQSLMKKPIFEAADYMSNVLCVENTTYTDYFLPLTGPKYRQVFNDDVISSPESFYKPDLDIIKVMKYALNEYSPQDLQVSGFGQKVTCPLLSSAFILDIVQTGFSHFATCLSH